MTTEQLPRVERWVEARCPKCPKTTTVDEGYTEDGEFYRSQAYCDRHGTRTFTPMKPYGVLPGNVQVKARKNRDI